MRTDHAFGLRNIRQMEVKHVDVVMNRAGTIAALITRDDGKSLQLYMTEQEARDFSVKLAGVKPHIDVVERSPYLKQHDATVNTENGVALVEYLGCGRYRVAKGAAYIQRHNCGHDGVYWKIEGRRAKFPTRVLAVSKIMENL